jgi:RNA recognition motif-containing protein
MPPKAAPKPAAKPAAKAAAPAAKPAAKAAAAPAAKPAAKQATQAAPAAKAAPKAAVQAGAGNGVYVKGLGPADVDAVKAIFAAAGNVVDVRLRRNKFAIVFFDNAAAVKKAVDTFNNKEVKGHTLSVAAAKAGPKVQKSTATVFIAPLFRQNTTRNQIRAIFEGCGKITKLRTYRTNFAYVTFENAAAAQKAIASKNGQTFRNKKLTVKQSTRA